MDNKGKNDESKLYQEAKKRVEIKSGFIVHRNIYITVIIGLSLMMGSLGAYSNEFWECMLAVLIVAMAWGMGIAIHFVVASRELKINDDNNIQKEIEFIKERRGEIPERGFGEPYREKHEEGNRDKYSRKHIDKGIVEEELEKEMD